MKTSKTNGWSENKNLVLHQLDEHAKRLESIESKIDKLILTILPKVSALEVKSSIFGLIGGAITVLISTGIYYLKH